MRTILLLVLAAISFSRTADASIYVIDMPAGGVRSFSQQFEIIGTNIPDLFDIGLSFSALPEQPLASVEISTSGGGSILQHWCPEGPCGRYDRWIMPIAASSDLSFFVSGAAFDARLFSIEVSLPGDLTLQPLSPAITAVPEPSTWAMLLIGFAGLGFMAHRRRKVRTLTV